MRNFLGQLSGGNKLFVETTNFRILALRLSKEFRILIATTTDSRAKLTYFKDRWLQTEYSKYGNQLFKCSKSSNSRPPLYNITIDHKISKTCHNLS